MPSSENYINFKNKRIMMTTNLSKPVHIHWDVTGSCNLNCKHCRASSVGNNDELSTDEAKALIDQIADINPEWMSFDGGEPLLRSDLFQLIAYARHKGLFTYLLTNGTLITDDIADHLKEADISSVQVSVDGLSESHDIIRGQGMFAMAIEGIRILLAHGIRTSVRITVSKYNIHDVAPLLELAIGLGVAAFGASRVVCVGNARGSDQAVDEAAYLDTIRNVCELGRGRIEVHIGMDPVLIPVTDIKDRILQDEGTLEVLAGCGAGISLLHIASNGDLFPCGVLPIRLGNIRQDKILDIWRSNNLIDRLSDRDELEGRCGECAYRYICGGCRAAAWLATGNPLGSDPQCLLDYEIPCECVGN
jgi:radical SAM protein with 4Fe4S-binding SPASM domain